MSFAHLHVHSEFSLLSGTASIEKLVARAAALKMKTLALTDTNRMSGLITFCKKCRDAGIKPILGAELTHPLDPREKVVLLAKDKEGYGDICELITRRNTESGDFSFAKLFENKYPRLYLLTGSASVFKELADTENRENLYGELLNHNPWSRQRSRHIEHTAAILGLPLVVTNDVYMLDRGEWATHKILRAISCNSTLSQLAPEEVAPVGSILKTEDEMRALFPHHLPQLEASGTIAEACADDLDLSSTWILPEITIPGGRCPEEHLEQIALQGLETNYGGSEQYPRAKDIQLRELRVIRKLGYASYFLMVKRIRDEANGVFHSGYRSLKDCTLMRGSAANSITFYNIGASDLDPIKYNLYFERFLNEERASPPDADLDFGWDERGDIFKFFEDTWGRDRVAVVCTTHHFRFAAAFREVAKVFGLSDAQITELEGRRRGASKIPNDPEIRNIWKYARAVRGKPRFLGQHCGGLIVTNQPIYRHVACEYSGGEKNRIITQIDMHNGLDELGLIKFDVLGNGSLSVLRDTLTQLADQGLPDPEVYRNEKMQNDPQVKDLIARGETRGIFYIESPAQMRLNMKARTTSFEGIGITSSLVRPAGTAYTRVFVERHRKLQDGIRDWSFLHDSLETILGDTHDVIAFQEDIIRICHEVAGMPLRRADRVRKMMNSLHEGVPDGYDEVEREFLQGCMGHKGYTLPQARELWERVSSFTGFSFCKSHSLSYAQLSFKCAYLKCYYPAQFMAAVISNSHGFYSYPVYLQEAKRFGVRTGGIHVNTSCYKYIGKDSGADPSGTRKIIPGFMHIRGMRRKSAEAIAVERERSGFFEGLEDFLDRVPVYKKEAEALIKVGAFNGLGLNQPQALYLLHKIFGKRKEKAPGGFEWNTARQKAPPFKDFSLVQKCVHELHLLGYTLSRDILEMLEAHPAARSAVPCGRLSQYGGETVSLFGWPIHTRLHEVPGHGSMKFLTLQDISGYADVIFWPRITSRYNDVLTGAGPFVVRGAVQEEWGTHVLIAEAVNNVGWSPNQIDYEAASEKLSKTLDKYKRLEKHYARSAA